MRNNTRHLFFWSGLFVCLLLITTCKKLEKSMLVSTDEATNIQTNTADLAGLIVDLGEGATQHGHYYGKSANLSTSDSKTEHGKPTSITGFISSLENLDAGATYYYSAYISDGSETILGKVKSFTTLAASLPTISTTEVADITSTSATGGGDITTDGGAPVTARGVCWNTSATPTIDNSKTTDGTGQGSFTSNLGSLTQGTTYYLRAYATNSAGTGYGNEVSFTTIAIVLPTVITGPPSNIYTTSASVGGNITSNGGETISISGVCWSKNPNPTINDLKTEDGAFFGSFSTTLYDLDIATLYHVRAYATNSAGTAYGEDLTFTTLPNLPVVTTSAVTLIASTTATSGGNVLSDGGGNITARGVCWGLYIYPTIADSKTDNGPGTGSFVSLITGLTPSAPYHVRAYATNASGTSYGDDIYFTTVTTPTVVTTAASYITTTSLTSGGNVTSAGGSTIESKGVCWSLTANPTINDQKTNEGVGAYSFYSFLTNLTPGTTYHIRAYATSAAGLTGYGDDITATTNSATLPTVTTSSTSSITSGSAYSGGDVTADGGLAVTAKGVCWSTITGPTTSDSKTVDGSGLGTFSSYLSGLNPGTKYYLRAYATNGVGSAYGTEYNFTTASTFPEAPVIGTATAGNQEATVSFTAPASDGGSAIVAYTVTSNPGNYTGSGSASPVKVSGLTNGTAYTFKVTATNAIGTSSASAYSNSVIPSTIPAVPVIASVTAGDGQVSITFIPTSDGGSAITGYTVTSNPGGITGSGTSSPVTVSGLTNGTAYTFTAVATNINGSSAASAASNLVTPFGIGTSYQGGIVAYILQPGDPGYNVSVRHGLIAASSDQSAGAEWGCSGTTISGADGTLLGTGLQNTIDIMVGCASATMAAKLCMGVTINGYNDWYLPSKDELNKLYINRVAIGGFATNYYWSSTESTSSNSWEQSFINGAQTASGKVNLYYVRAIRAF